MQYLENQIANHYKDWHPGFPVDYAKLYSIVQDHRDRLLGGGDVKEYILFNRILLSRSGVFKCQVRPLGLSNLISIPMLKFADPRASYSYYPTGIHLTSPDAKCSLCGGFWSIRDVMSDWESAGSDHPDCVRIQQEREQRAKFEACFKEAGFFAYLRNITNGYGGTGYPYLDWYEAQTVFGPIRIGWRKRVISIEYHGVTTPENKVRLEAKNLIQDDVTRDGHLVHAWGYEKAVKYLRLIREAF